MGHAFFNLAFTDSVKAAQERHGSRRIYGHMDQDGDGDNGAVLEAREVSFITAADHFFQASVGETGWPYVQHRGGPAGFLRVLDRHTIGFADLSGNRQYISLGNLQHDGRVALIIIDWSARRRLKIMGHVTLVDAASDPALVARLAVPGYGQPERAYLIRVAAFDWNCPQHLTERIPRAQAEQQLAALRTELTRLRQASAPVAELDAGDGPHTLVVQALRLAGDQVRLVELAAEGGAALPADPATMGQLTLVLRRPDGAPVHAVFAVQPLKASPQAGGALVLELDAQSGPLHAALLPHLQLGTLLHGVQLGPAPAGATAPSSP